MIKKKKQKKNKKKPTEWEKIFANHMLGKELLSKTYQYLKYLNSKTANNPIKNLGRESK